jgi:hypothetical protein
MIMTTHGVEEIILEIKALGGIVTAVVVRDLEMTNLHLSLK